MSNWHSSYRFSKNPQGKSQATGGSNPVNSDSSSYLDDQYPDSLGSDMPSIALIGPDEERRGAVGTALAECRGGEVREFSSYPPSLDDMPKLLEQHYDVIIIDLDSHPEYALELVESICASGGSTVMVYSMKADAELLVRCMRAGAREFLTLPFAQNTMAEALVRASARRPAPRLAKKAGGRLLVFFGAKGGDGVTTLACNFAVSLAQESGQGTLLIDLDLPLGDAALNLGVTAEYSTINALQNANRLDASFFSKLLVKHSSGVSVLAAPGKFPQFDASDEAVDRLITVARQEFENVVVDMGSRLDLMGTSLFKDGSTVYLVIQAGIAGLRNSNRLISQYFTGVIPKLEIVLNRYEPRTLGVSEDQITKALTRPAQWKIPNDYEAVRRMQTTAVPLALEDSSMSRQIRQMSRTACGLPATPEKDKRAGFSLKSLRRSLSGKSSSPEDSAITQLGLGHDQEDAGATATMPGKPARTSAVGAAHEAGTKMPPPSTDKAELADAKRGLPEGAGGAHRQDEPETRVYKGATYVKGADGEWRQQKTLVAGAPKQGDEPETRNYKGATYVKGADGEWHLQKAAAEGGSRETPAIAWPTPAPIVYGAALSDTELNATASVPGRFVYTPAAGDTLTAGTHTLSVTFTPADAAAYVEANATVDLTVSKATPIMRWRTLASITYGTALSTAELNATSSVPGRFVYTPRAGEVIQAGEQTLSVTFTPTDSMDYSEARATVPLTVAKATPTISWPEPAAITYGTALSATELNAKASVPGSFVYTPGADEVLTAGVQTLSAAFTPADSRDYAEAQATVQLTVAKATPAITWPAPASITYGTALSATELNAAASVPGTFVYTPGAGEVLTAGVQTLSATFTPKDSLDYTEAQATVQITVAKATPAITWPTPDSITYGTALSATELNATASVPGEFVYIPAAGAVLAAGTHTPSVTFTPKDTLNYTGAQAAVQFTVTKAAPSVSWPTPDEISYGTVLGAAQLNATASVAGRFVYRPGAGEVLPAGTHTLSATFTPTDAAGYAAVKAEVSLTVAMARSIAITWPAPAAIPHGAALGAAQLNATAPVSGRFVYTPAAGEVLATGTHTLSVAFTPEDANFPAAQASVPLTVTKAAPTITWLAPAAISYGTALSAAQLNARASVLGSFVYTPAAGEVPGAGTHTLSVTFTPDDDADNAAAQAAVSLTVTKATPIITWPTPAAISYGFALSTAQLNATALIPGTFAYTPAAGTVLTAGTQTLSVIFTPSETANYTPAQATVSLVVEGLPNIASLMPAMAGAEVSSHGPEEAMREASPSGSTPMQENKPETRTYKGATYVKGADGQWYLQKN